MKTSFHSHADKTHFPMKSFARSLGLKKRHKTIPKWPIGKGGGGGWNLRNNIENLVKLNLNKFCWDSREHEA